MAQAVFVASNCFSAIASSRIVARSTITDQRVNGLPSLSHRAQHSNLSGGLAYRSPSLILLREACSASSLESSSLASSRRLTVFAAKGTEDGIFGSSGGFGFTKQNELFVGRLAMLGFAASLLGEAVTSKGICAQLGLETGIPLNESEPLVIFFIVFNVLGAIGALGDRGRFVDEAKTGLDRAVISPGKGVKSALGLAEKGPTFGFTKANELFVGRIAQLGFVASILGEVVTGKGALAQLNIETGVPLNEIEPLLIFFILFFFVAAVIPGTGKFVVDDE